MRITQPYCHDQVCTFSRQILKLKYLAQILHGPAHPTDAPSFEGRSMDLTAEIQLFHLLRKNSVNFSYPHAIHL